MKNRSELLAVLAIEVVQAIGREAVHLAHFFPEDAPDFMSDHYTPPESLYEPPREA